MKTFKLSVLQSHQMRYNGMERVVRDREIFISKLSCISVISVFCFALLASSQVIIIIFFC